MLHGTDIIPWNIFIFSLSVENFYEKNTHLRPIYACCILQCKMWSKLAPFTETNWLSGHSESKLMLTWCANQELGNTRVLTLDSSIGMISVNTILTDDFHSVHMCINQVFQCGAFMRTFRDSSDPYIVTKWSLKHFSQIDWFLNILS